MTAPATPNTENERHVISPLRFSLAAEALTELEHLLSMYGGHIIAVDQSGEIEPVTRGFIRRAKELSYAISEAIGHFECIDEQDLKERVAAPEVLLSRARELQ